tara:strand:+ start:835 stop:1083 length:249 start_codon:yes stop_codon:yes gene_type:complete
MFKDLLKKLKSFFDFNKDGVVNTKDAKDAGKAVKKATVKRAKAVKKEIADVGKAVKEVGKQTKQVASAVAGKKRRGRKPAAK